MHRQLGMGAFLCIAVMVPLGAGGQLCTGGPVLGSVNAGNVNLGASFFDGGKAYGLGVTYGHALFGTAAFTYTDYDNTTLSFKEIGGTVGYQLASSSGSVNFCPMVGVSRGFGLEIAGINMTTVSVSPAVAVGVTADVSPTVKVTPFAEAAFHYQRTTADAGPLGKAAQNDTNGALALGVGFSFNDKLTLGPTVLIPIGVANGNTVFGVGLAIAVGSRQ